MAEKKSNVFSNIAWFVIIIITLWIGSLIWNQHQKNTQYELCKAQANLIMNSQVGSGVTADQAATIGRQNAQALNNCSR